MAWVEWTKNFDQKTERPTKKMKKKNIGRMGQRRWDQAKCYTLAATATTTATTQFTQWIPYGHWLYMQTTHINIVEQERQLKIIFTFKNIC